MYQSRMPRVCFEEKPQINTFYDDVEVCKRGGKKKKAKAKATISNVNKVIVNLTHGNRHRMTAPARNFANQPKALQSITYSNPVAPSHFSNAPAQTHTPMNIYKDTVEEKVRDSIPTFKTLENPNGITSADTRAQRAIPSRIPSAGVLSSQPPRASLQTALAAIPSGLPSYFPPTGSASNLPKPRPAQEEIARPSNFVPLVAAQPESREVQQQRSTDQPIRGFVGRLDESSGSNERMSAYQKQVAEHKAKGEAFIPSSNRAAYYAEPKAESKPKGFSEKQIAFMKSHQDEKEPSKKRGGSVF